MMKVLVADDDPVFRELVAAILEEGGFEPVTAVDGQEGWEKLLAEKPQMAVLDYNMPRLDGLQLIERIRADEALRGMPILLLTIRALVEDQVKGYDGGADDYLTKPFDNQMLLTRLKVLERRILKK